MARCPRTAERGIMDMNKEKGPEGSPFRSLQGLIS